MSRSGSRTSARLGLAALLLAVAASGCSASNPTPKTPKPAILPASARIVRTVDFVLPPVPLPPSAKPDAGQQAVVFLNASTGFVAPGRPAGRRGLRDDPHDRWRPGLVAGHAPKLDPDRWPDISDSERGLRHRLPTRSLDRWPAVDQHRYWPLVARRSRYSGSVSSLRG